MKSRSNFGKLYEKRNLLGKGIEIGVQRGHNIVNIARYWKGSIIGVDLFENDNIYREALNNTFGLKVNLIKGSSLDMASKTPDNSLDWVYIDADHTYKSVCDDIRAWYSKVRKDGIVSGHDYYKTKSGNVEVINAVDEYVKEHGYELKLTDWDNENPHKDERQPSWYFVKT